MNILVAVLIYIGLFSTVGKQYPATDLYQQNGLSFTDVGKKIGFQDGDKIVSVDGKTQDRFNWMVVDVLLGDDVIVDRNGKEVTLHLTDENKKDILSKEGRGFVSPRIPAVMDTVVADGNAYKAGLRNGDKIVAVNNTPIQFYDELSQTIQQNRAQKKNDSVYIRVERTVGNQVQPLDFKLTTNSDGKIGVASFPNPDNFMKVDKMPLGKAIGSGLKESYTVFVYNIKQFKLLVKPKTEAYKQVKSPVGMVSLMPTTWDWYNVFSFGAFISLALAFMNLLPIPGLDGGHALFTIVEMVTGKKLSDKAAGVVQTVGMVILLSLMVLVFGKDIWQLIAG